MKRDLLLWGIAVFAFWLVHFFCSVVGFTLLEVSTLHPEALSDAGAKVTLILLFPLFNCFVRMPFSPDLLAAFNSAIWTLALVVAVTFWRRRRASSVNAAQPAVQPDRP